MDQATIDDLKQFIATTISQQTAYFATKSDLANLATKSDLANLATKSDLANLATKSDLKKVNHTLSDIQAAIADAMSNNNDAVDAQLIDHEQRLTKLEHYAA